MPWIDDNIPKWLKALAMQLHACSESYAWEQVLTYAGVHVKLTWY